MVVEERKTSPSYLGALQRQIGELAQVRRDNSACGSFQSDSSKKVSFVDVRRSNTVWNEVNQQGFFNKKGGEKTSQKGELALDSRPGTPEIEVLGDPSSHIQAVNWVNLD
ncbi:hypothetical protein BofuT4_P066810.1 [Botrytis cinerea T4]|uniref:Uncharacterized protein n=1 Tax=Botryotinia fuckeliana (strain T4) TaxID=999810 RepID=G2XRA5_BOTF4|nr:hypothetical protein BofuT4_P066810.1 [Botrytis cinerea T4]